MVTKHPFLFLLGLVALFYSPVPTRAQDRTDDMVRVRTRVVFIDTLVQDKKTGAPVADLMRELGLTSIYHDLGKATAPGLDTKANAVELVGIGALPLVDRFSVYGKLGIYRGELKAAGAKENNSDVTYGAGLQYDFTKTVGVRGEWQRYNKMGGGAIAKTDVDVLSVGVVYRFQ